MWNAISLVLGFELVSPCSFPTTITITPRASPPIVLYFIGSNNFHIINDLSITGHDLTISITSTEMRFTEETRRIQIWLRQFMPKAWIYISLHSLLNHQILWQNILFAIHNRLWSMISWKEVILSLWQKIVSRIVNVERSPVIIISSC